MKTPYFCGRIAGLLASCLFVCSAPAQFNYATNNGTIMITGYTDTNSAVIIPDTINGLPVTRIDNWAFSSLSSLTSVTIPNSVTSIGYAAFDGSGLTSATIPDSVISMDEYVFSDCNSLTNVTIGNSVTNIGRGIFEQCYSLTSVTIPDSVTNIGPYAFYECFNLTSVTIPNGVTTIGDDTFYRCNSLTNLTIPNTVTNIGNAAFLNCQSLTSVTIPNSVTSIGQSAFVYCSGLTSVTIPGSVAIISYSAFDACSGLTNVTIGNGVNNISSHAFQECTDLTTVTIPSSVTNVSDWAFSDCTSLSQVLFQGNAPMVDGALGSVNNLVFQPQFLPPWVGTVYYLPGTTGWDTTFGGWPTAMWYLPQPQILGSSYGLGVSSNGFQFTISWATNTAVVVEASANLLNWTSVSTNTLVSGTSAFVDPLWTNSPQQFYRVRPQ